MNSGPDSNSGYHFKIRKVSGTRIQKVSRMKHTNVISLAIGAGLIAALAACGSLPRFKPVSLVGTSWTATSYSAGETSLRTPLEGSAITAEFGEDGTISGTAGCNSYSGPYEVSGEAIEIGEVVSTLMACTEPEGIMEQEQTFLGALKNAERFQHQGEILVLFDSRGNRLIEFESNGE
jgi:heat shock protein HslJ